MSWSISTPVAATAGCRRWGWRCLNVEELSEIRLEPGAWRTAENVFNPQTCLDEVEVLADPLPPRARRVHPDVSALLPWRLGVSVRSSGRLRLASAIAEAPRHHPGLQKARQSGTNAGPTALFKHPLISLKSRGEWAAMIGLLCRVIGHQRTLVAFTSNRFSCRRCGADLGRDIPVNLAVDHLETRVELGISARTSRSCSRSRARRSCSLPAPARTRSASLLIVAIGIPDSRRRL